MTSILLFLTKLDFLDFIRHNVLRNCSCGGLHEIGTRMQCARISGRHVRDVLDPEEHSPLSGRFFAGDTRLV